MKRHMIGAVLAAVVTWTCLAGCGENSTANASGGVGATSDAGGIRPGDPGPSNDPGPSGSGPPSPTPGRPFDPGGPSGGQYPKQPKPPPMPDDLFDRAGGISTWEGARSRLYQVCEDDDSIHEKFSVAGCRVAVDYLVTSEKAIVDQQPDASLGPDRHCSLGWDNDKDQIVITSDFTDDCAATLLRTRPKPGQKPRVDGTTSAQHSEDGGSTESTTVPGSLTPGPTS